jgi:hypothetical protein
MNWSGAAYLDNQGGQTELDRQQREAALEEHRKNSLGYQIGHGVSGALKGAAGGAIKGGLTGLLLGGPVGLAAGATLGGGSGLLSGSGIMSGQEQKGLATNAAMMALSKGMSGPAAAGNPAGPRPTDYQDYANAEDPNFTGPAYMQPQGAQAQVPWWKRFQQ